jgi:hypothetical protein
MTSAVYPGTGPPGDDPGAVLALVQAVVPLLGAWRGDRCG